MAEIGLQVKVENEVSEELYPDTGERIIYPNSDFQRTVNMQRLGYEIFRDIGESLKSTLVRYKSGQASGFVCFNVGSLRLQPYLTEAAVVPIFDTHLKLTSGKVKHAIYAAAHV